MHLFHQSAIVASLGSGSRGNCTYVGDEKSGVLVDCGLSARQVYGRLEALGLAGVRIDAVLVTHEHNDHVAAAGVLDRRMQPDPDGPCVPFFMTPGTRRNLHPNVVPRRVELITAGRPFRVGRFRVEPVSVPHDVPDPVAFLVELGPTRVGVITDLGRATRLVEQAMSTLDIAVLEFNHDVDRLMDGDYPWSLKQRVRGPHGHLSNAQSEEIVVAGASARLRHLVLAHPSSDNNTPELAIRHAERGLHRAGRRGVEVNVGHPEIPRQAQIARPMFADPLQKQKRARMPGMPAQDDSARQVSLFP